MKKPSHWSNEDATAVRIRFPAALIMVMAIIVGIASGCGGPSKEELEADRRAYLNELRPLVERREGAVVERKCRERIGGFIEALQTLDSKITVGLTYSDYGSQVGDVRVQYDRTNQGGGLPANCSGAVDSGESAMDEYMEAHSEWSDCLNAEGDWSWAADEYGFSDCETDWIEPIIQANWSKASRAADKAQRLLNGIDQRAASQIVHSYVVPADTASVGPSIYGAIVTTLCTSDVPLTATEPCQDLIDILSDGVSDGELSKLNDALRDLSETYGVAESPSPTTTEEGSA